MVTSLSLHSPLIPYQVGYLEDRACDSFDSVQPWRNKTSSFVPAMTRLDNESFAFLILGSYSGFRYQ